MPKFVYSTFTCNPDKRWKCIRIGEHRLLRHRWQDQSHVARRENRSTRRQSWNSRLERAGDPRRRKRGHCGGAPGADRNEGNGQMRVNRAGLLLPRGNPRAKSLMSVRRHTLRAIVLVLRNYEVLRSEWLHGSERSTRFLPMNLPSFVRMELRSARRRR